MKATVFTATLILLFGCTKIRPEINPPPPAESPVTHGVSDEKNIRPIHTYPLYSAFGFLEETRTNIYTYYYRMGKGHLTGGKDYYMEYNELTDHWSDTMRIPIEFTKDARDINGGRMDNDSTVLFISQSNNGRGGDNSIDTRVVKCDSNNHFGSPRDFNWSVIPTLLERRWIFGNTVKGDNKGEYYVALIQMNVAAPARRRITIIKTTDYWNHYYEVGVVYDGTTSFSETAIGKFGGGKFVALMRNDLSGSLAGYESSNNCVTWSARQASNLFWWISGGAEIPNILHEDDGTLTIFFECRDARYMMLSRNNNVSQNFGTAIYQKAEMWSYNMGGGNSALGSLGYGAIKRLKGGNKPYLLIYAHQDNSEVSYLMYSRSDLMTDPDGIPDPPPQIDTLSVSSTQFRIDINGYTQRQLDNIRWFNLDVSTDSTFSNFVTLKYQNPSSAVPATQMHNIRMLGRWDLFSNAISGTTYWVRIKAVNNAGSSPPSIQIAKPK